MKTLLFVLIALIAVSAFADQVHISGESMYSFSDEYFSSGQIKVVIEGPSAVAMFNKGVEINGLEVESRKGPRKTFLHDFYCKQEEFRTTCVYTKYGIQ